MLICVETALNTCFLLYESYHCNSIIILKWLSAWKGEAEAVVSVSAVAFWRRGKHSTTVPTWYSHYSGCPGLSMWLQRVERMRIPFSFCLLRCRECVKRTFDTHRMRSGTAGSFLEASGSFRKVVWPGACRQATKRCQALKSNKWKAWTHFRCFGNWFRGGNSSRLIYGMLCT